VRVRWVAVIDWYASGLRSDWLGIDARVHAVAILNLC
jgi:hypothetical protein